MQSLHQRRGAVIELVQWPPFEHAARRVVDVVLDQEHLRIDSKHLASNSRQLEPRYDREQDVDVDARVSTLAEAARSFVDRYSAAEHVNEHSPNLFIFVGDNRYSRVLLDAADDEVEGLGRGDIGQNGIEGSVYAKSSRGNRKDHHVEYQNHIADFEQRRATADQYGGSL